MDSWERFQLICKPEQSGKTFLMIQHIIRDIESPGEGKEMIHIILCDNNLLLTKQTSQRVDTELTEFIQDGITYVELSSHQRAACHDMHSAYHAIVSRGIRHVICCTNARRMDDVYELVNSLNKGEFTRERFHTTIWVDEADKFTGYIDDTFIPIVENFDQVHIKLITATPESLFKAYKYINVLPIENTTTDQYHGWNDNDIQIHPTRGCLEFAEYILTDVGKDLVLPGTKWFIPSMTTKESHTSMKELCVEAKMAVLVVNGDGVVLTIPYIEPIQIEKDTEINTILMNLYERYQLSRYAFAITGNICIGRGISIMSDGFMMDYAILSHFSGKSDASQLAGRVKGNIKHFSSYKKCTVFTTSVFNKVVTECEEKSRNLARIAYEKELEGEGTIIGLNEFKTCEKPHEHICHPKLFNTFKETKQFLTTKAREMRCRGKLLVTDKGAIRECKEGYLVSSKLISEGQTADDLTKSDRLTLEKANAIPYGRCISSTDKGSPYLILPVYASESSPPKEYKFQVRYIRFK
jgi:hypothetical protein